MLGQNGFDMWAAEYDKATELSDADSTYPFAGYGRVLESIYRRIMSKPGSVILDIGFGTAALTARLYESGCEIWGQDFSEKMIDIAVRKMPAARLYQGDFSVGLATPLLKRRYDFIVATYSLHHLTGPGKADFIRLLTGLLKDGGSLLIGDIAFETRELLDICRSEAGNDWDDEEHYFVIEELRKDFPQIRFNRVSFCAGMIELCR